MRQLPLISQGSLCLPESPSKGRQGEASWRNKYTYPGIWNNGTPRCSGTNF